jgi:chemotaxis protein methyltransferase CheR
MLIQTDSKETRETLLTGLVLDHLYRWVEMTLGIRAGDDALEKLKEYLEQRSGASYFEDSAAFEAFLNSPDEIYTITQLVTVNETYFFREEAQFNLLFQELLPRFARLGRPVRVCSAAASIGCEAYSIAMAMDYFAQTMEPLAFKIDAFDINPMVIETARKGRYTRNAFRADGAQWKDVLDRYVSRKGADYLVSEALREHIHFYSHNIMNGFKDRYDLIFFRNALIYFSAENRRRLFGFLAEALNEEGFLILGAAETSLVSHPLLVNRFLRDNFCFQRAGGDAGKNPVERRLVERRITDRRTGERRGAPADRPGTVTVSTAAVPQGSPSFVDPVKLAALIADNGGELSAQRILRAIGEAKRSGAGVDAIGVPAGLSGDELCAAAIYLLGIEDFAGADPVISLLEERGKSAFSAFLRGEFYFHKNKTAMAETCFKEAAGMDGSFWPAFYRMSTIAAGSGLKRYKYRTGKALESIELGRNKRYENFIGGFSPDYYRRALEKRLTEQAGNDRV